MGDEMVKRVTLSVPDGLHKKMMAWRNSIIYSKEFQRHISKLIEKKEELKREVTMKGKSQKDSENMKTLRMAKIGDDMYLHQGDVCNIIGQMKRASSTSSFPDEIDALRKLLEILGCNCIRKAKS